MKTSNILVIGVGVIEIILGICLIFAKASLITILLSILGIVLLINGLVQIISCVINCKVLDYGERNLTSGSLSSVIGIILIAKAGLVVGIVTVIIGLWLMINGILQISASITMKNFGMKLWIISTIFGIVGLIFGYLLVTIDEVKLELMLNTYIGISLMFSGLGTIIAALSSRIVKSR